MQTFINADSVSACSFMWYFSRHHFMCRWNALVRELLFTVGRVFWSFFGHWKLDNNKVLLSFEIFRIASSVCQFVLVVNFSTYSNHCWSIWRLNKTWGIFIRVPTFKANLV